MASRRTWIERWRASSIYEFDRSATRENVYSIDTPPPTVSGELHMGHIFSYTHSDLLARFWRMNGKKVFYPMGWDDNGLPTERRVENFYGVRCDPSLPYQPDFTPPEKSGDTKLAISRKNFVELCRRRTEEDEEVFKNLWRHLGLSIDWSLEYSTVSEHAQEVSQRGFLSMLARGEVYSSVAPTLWDVDFRTAVSQAELEDRERPANYHRIAFAKVGGNGNVEIETTRPELLASCVALVAHPDDARYSSLFGTNVRHATVRDRSARARARTRRSREGLGHRDDLHLRRHDRRHLVARVVATDTNAHWPRRSIPRVRLHERGVPESRAGGCHRLLRTTRRKDRQPGARDGGRRVTRERRTHRRTATHHAPGQVLREGRTAPRDRDLAPVVRPDARAS